MSAERDPIVAARRELHELAVLSSALLRLATKVQSRCDELRKTLGEVAPIDEREVDQYAPRQIDADGASVAPPGGAEAQSEEDDPAALLAMSLAGEGMSRDQISDYLRQSFGMQDTDALLDRVLPEQT
ncbi:MAG TPA: hypothetical protein VF533_01495 [Solirubrobacteraceae bacterium]|jgi:hypothetical protein